MMNKAKGKMREEIDMSLKKVQWSEAQSRQVLARIARGEGRRRRAGFRTAAVVGLCLLMTATAFAVDGTLFERVQSWLGGFGEYAEPVEGVFAEDQGIRVGLVGAVGDSHESKLYFSVQDTDADRLSQGGLNADFHLDIKEPQQSAYRFGSKFMGYDADTKTALLEVEYGGEAGPERLQGAIRFTAFKPGVIEVEAPLPMEQLSGEVLATMETGETLLWRSGGESGEAVSGGEKAASVLTPELTPAEIEGAEGVRLSSFGFGDDGWLHLQLRLPQQAVAEETAAGRTVNLLTTINSNTEGLNSNWKYNQDIREACFTYNGERYLDLAFYGATPADLADIGPCSLYGAYAVEAVIDGQWNLDFDTALTPERAVEANVRIDDIQVTGIVLSDIAVTVESRCDEPKLLYRKPLTVYFADGTSAAAKNVPGSSWTLDEEAGTGRGQDRWTWDKPIDAAQAVAVEIGGQRIEL